MSTATDADLPAGYRWATAEETEMGVPGIVVPRTVDNTGKPYTQGEADIAVPEFPRDILSRDEEMTGIVTGSTQRCRLTGCNGLQYLVRWPNGKRSWPCSKGIEETDDGTWRIG
jgi:hypothetical protein